MDPNNNPLWSAIADRDLRTLTTLLNESRLAVDAGLIDPGIERQDFHRMRGEWVERMSKHIEEGGEG